MAKVVDAVLAGVGTKFEKNLYFFMGDRYLRVVWSTGVVEANEPISAWGFPSPFDKGVDAACNGHGDFEGKAYFFKGSQYITYDWGTDAVEKGPQPIALWKVTVPFAAGIDAALEGGKGFEEWVYFFKASKYIRYRWPDKVKGTVELAEVSTDGSGTPYTLQTGWNLPSGFRARVDAAINDKRISTGNDTYFYAGHQFILYHWDDTHDPPVSFASWQRPASWLLPAAVTRAAGLFVDAGTAMIWSDKAPYAHNFKASDPATKDWQAVWSFTPGSSATVVMMYFHGLHGMVTVANPDWAPTYIFSGPPSKTGTGPYKLPAGVTLAATVKGLNPVQPMDGILPSFWGSDSCTYNYVTHLKPYGGLYYCVCASAPKYRVDEVAKNKGYVALVPEVGDQSGNKDITSGFQLAPFINDVLTKLAATTGIVDPSGADKTYAVPAASAIAKVLITGHSAGGGILKQLQADPLFTSSAALSVAIGVFDGLYGSWGTGYGALYKANPQLRIWLVNFTSATAGAVEADFAAAGIGHRELDATGALTKNPANKQASKTGLYLYTMPHTLGKNDGSVQAALANPGYGAILIQTDTDHDQIPNRFLPWMADAL